MIRILSYATQLSDHLKIRDALKSDKGILSNVEDDIKIDSVFSVEIIPNFLKKSAREEKPIHLIVFNERMTDDVSRFLPDTIPIICTTEVEQLVSFPSKDLIFAQTFLDRNAFKSLVTKCLQLQILKYDLKQSQSARQKGLLSKSNFVDILGDYLNQAFILNANLALILFKFVSYGREPEPIKSLEKLKHRYYDYLQTLLPSGWRIYVFGANDLAVVVEKIEVDDGFRSTLHHLHQEANKFFSDHGIVLSVDMGVALSWGKVVDPVKFYDQAKTALLIANRKGHGFIEYYGKEQEHNLLYFTKVESDLKQVLRDRKLNVVYQPLIDLEALKTVGVEALVRWNHPTLGQISPVEFLPIAERISGMNDLADIVFHHAFKDLKLLKERHMRLSMSVNIAGQQLISGKLVTHLLETTQLYGITPQEVELEVTEDFDLNHIDPIVYQLEELKNLGFKIVIDDFGIGYSSLHYLSQFPVDKIKIDRSFIQDLNEKKVKILQAMFNLAKFMNLETLVEGIETVEQLEMLKSVGAQYGQGYLFSSPLSVDKLDLFLTKNTEFATTMP